MTTVAPGGNGVERPHDGGAIQERDVLRQRDANGVARIAGRTKNGLLIVGQQDAEHGDHHAEADADEQVGRQDADDRHHERHELVATLSDTSPRTAQAWPACTRPRAGWRPAWPAESGSAAPAPSRLPTSRSTPCRMAEALDRAPDWMFAELRTMTCVTGRPPIRPGDHVAQPLGFQLAVGRRDALERVELVGRLHAQQRFEAGDTASVIAVVYMAGFPSCVKSGGVNNDRKLADAVGDRNLHQVRRLDDQRRRDRPETSFSTTPSADGHERPLESRDEAFSASLPVAPTAPARRATAARRPARRAG